MRFASLLADNLTQASIKVYLSAVRSLHIEYGLSDPFTITPAPAYHPGSSASDSTWTGLL